MATKMTTSEFIDYISNLVLDHRKTSKVKPDFFDSVSVAQACLESGYGTSTLYLAFNNSFGYKAKAGEWSGKIAGDYPSDEEINGVKVKGVASDFRAYDSVADSVKDHANMMTGRGQGYIKTYDKAINAKTPQEQAHALTNVYATDSEYGEKLVAIMDKYNLYKLDSTGSQEKEEEKKVGYVQFDIGHGSDTRANGGGKAVYKNGKWHEEHSFNSLVAIKTKALVEKAGHKLNITYGPQQPNSPEKSLSSRSSFANTKKVDLFISFHANYVDNTNVNGICVFYDGYISGSQRLIKSKALAQSIMAKFKKQGQSVYTGGMGDLAGSIPSYSDSWTDFHVNRVTTMPSILAELGFMSGSKDFDKVFGSQQATYTDQVAKVLADSVIEYFGGEIVETPVNNANPQNLKSTAMKPYVAPTQEFTTKKVGDIATLAVNFQWADVPNSLLLRSNRYDELVGAKDEIIEVMDISHIPNRNHSNFAYKLKNFNSWILEEYIVEAKENWTDGIVDVPEAELPEFVNDKNYDVYEFEQGYVAIRKTVENKKSEMPAE